MAAIIPDATLGATYTNEITGVTYTYDGMKWVIEGVTENDHEHELPEHEHELPEHKHDENYLRKSGDIMSGSLFIQTESKDKIGLLVYGGKDADDNDKDEVAAFANSDGVTILEIKNHGRVMINQRHGYVPKYSGDVITKGYVDPPAKYGWIVKTASVSPPPAGETHFDSTSITNSTAVRIPFKSNSGGLDLYAMTDNATIYDDSDGKHFMLSAYYTGADVDGKWKFKGFANVTKIETYLRNDVWYFLLTLGDKKIGYGNFKSDGEYRFTIPGLF